jgi:hypothetical protein
MSVTSAINALDTSSWTYADARAQWPGVQDAYYAAFVGVDTLPQAGFGGKTAIDAQYTAIRDDLFNSNVADDAPYPSGDQFKQLWDQLAIQASANDAGYQTQVAAVNQIPGDIADAAKQVASGIVDYSKWVVVGLIAVVILVYAPRRKDG